MWPEDEVWEWTNSADNKLPLVDGGMEKPVTRENYGEFRDALLAKLVEESTLQMRHVKRGVVHTLGDADYLRRFVNWHDLMIASEGHCLKACHDKSRSLVVEHTKYFGCDDEHA